MFTRLTSWVQVRWSLVVTVLLRVHGPEELEIRGCPLEVIFASGRTGGLFRLSETSHQGRTKKTYLLTLPSDSSGCPRVPDYVPWGSDPFLSFSTDFIFFELHVRPDTEDVLALSEERVTSESTPGRASETKDIREVRDWCRPTQEHSKSRQSPCPRWGRRYVFYVFQKKIFVTFYVSLALPVKDYYNLVVVSWSPTKGGAVSRLLKRRDGNRTLLET